LPDITLVLPVFIEAHDAPFFYVAARAHHADVGGMFAGSMGPARSIRRAFVFLRSGLCAVERSTKRCCL
jgi:N-methylhydantoinase B/oxoprolinase/acetone carboxylase alpha subunit